MARRRYDTQHQPPDVDLVTVAHRLVVERELCAGRCDDLRSSGVRQLRGAGDEVSVQMGFGGDADAKAAPAGGVQIRTRITAGIDDQRRPIAQRHQPARVAQSLVADRNDLQHGHSLIK
jgi:hypothetical protein